MNEYLSCLVIVVLVAATWSCTSESRPESGDAPVDSAAAAAPDTSASAEEMTVSYDSIRWSEGPLQERRTVSEVAVVGEVRSGSHSDYDRVVIEFQNGTIPGYQVSYLDGDALECGSGGLIDLAGSAALEVRLEPARGYNENGQSTVEHAQRDFDMDVLREAEVSCDFEAVFALVLGVTQRQPIRALELTEPARLVVDIRHSVD